MFFFSSTECLQEGRAGYTPFHIAVENNNVKLAQFLLESSKQLNTETLCYRQVTAYQQAAELGLVDMLNTLERFGCEVISPPESDMDDSDESVDAKQQNSKKNNRENHSSSHIHTFQLYHSLATFHSKNSTLYSQKNSPLEMKIYEKKRQIIGKSESMYI